MASEFGAEIRRLRLRAGKTLSDIAVALGNVSVPYASDIERGQRNPPVGRRLLDLLTSIGAESEYARIASLAAKERGRVEIETEDAQTREMLVALERSIESRSLEREQLEEIRRILEKGKDSQ
jgi:transcriptional regulator with XRE-family HTH domain